MNDLKHFQIITHSPTSDPVGQAWYSAILIERIGDQSNVASSVRGRALPAMQETKM